MHSLEQDFSHTLASILDWHSPAMLSANESEPVSAAAAPLGELLGWSCPLSVICWAVVRSTEFPTLALEGQQAFQDEHMRYLDSTASASLANSQHRAATS